MAEKRTKVQVWRLWVAEGFMAAVHDSYCPIVEIFVPDLNLHINKSHYFLGGQGRYEIKKEDKNFLGSEYPSPELLAETDLPDDVLQSLQLIRQAKLKEGEIRVRLADILGDVASGLLPEEE